MQNLPDEFLLESMRFYGYHGVNPEERVLGQQQATGERFSPFRPKLPGEADAVRNTMCPENLAPVRSSLVRLLLEKLEAIATASA